MVFGVVSGSRIRSRKVATASVVGLRRFSGLVSKRSKGRQAAAASASSACRHGDAARPARQEAVERRQRGIADRLLLLLRPGEDQPGGQGGQADHDADQHAGRGDDAEFGQAAVVGRQEGQEAGAERQRGEPDARPGDRRGGHQGGAERLAAQPVALLPQADRVLDREVDREPDEQHGEGDGERIVGPDEQGAEGGGDGQPQDQHAQHGQDQPHRPQAEPEQGGHGEQGQDVLRDRPAEDGGELLVADHRARR